ncbi:MAG TPA: hypothetical protein VGJ70_02235, partial [Solirubrobacteraceae bacterium]
MLAAIVDVARVGLPVMTLLIAGESMGVPLPGETALIAAAILAGRGQLDIVAVIVLASFAAIVGDNEKFTVQNGVGSQSPLAAFALSSQVVGTDDGPLVLDAPSITTTGGQTFGSSLSLYRSTALGAGGEVAFAGDVTAVASQPPA